MPSLLPWRTLAALAALAASMLFAAFAVWPAANPDSAPPVPLLIEPRPGSDIAYLRPKALPQDRFLAQFPEIVHNDTAFLLGQENPRFSMGLVQWRRMSAGGWLTTARQPGLGAYTIRLSSQADGIEMDWRVQNLSKQEWTYVAATPHIAFTDAPDFRDPAQQRTFLRMDGAWVPIDRTDRSDGRTATQWYIVRGHRASRMMGSRPHPNNAWGLSQSHPDDGLVAVVSHDRAWIVGEAFADTQYICLNAPVCVHPAGFFGNLAPGQARRLRGKIYFLHGSLADLLAHFHRDFPAQAAANFNERGGRNRIRRVRHGPTGGGR